MTALQETTSCLPATAAAGTPGNSLPSAIDWQSPRQDMVRPRRSFWNVRGLEAQSLERRRLLGPTVPWQRVYGLFGFAVGVGVDASSNLAQLDVAGLRGSHQERERTSESSR
jgi:hypothetical protein